MAKKKTRKNYGLAAFLERHASGETDFHDFVMHAKFKGEASPPKDIWVALLSSGSAVSASSQ